MISLLPNTIQVSDDSTASYDELISSNNCIIQYYKIKSTDTLSQILNDIVASNNDDDDHHDENNIELFAHINLFHLIGSFRYYYLLNTENYSEILRRLNDILSVTTCHPLIKYSALQISILVSIKSDEIEIKEAYKHIPSFRDEYLKQLEYMENTETSLLVKYVSFYSMYYYENKYQSKALINEKYLDRMINKETNSIDFKYLHTLIPQLASQLIRLDVEIYNKNEIGERLRLLFDFEKTNRDNIKEIKKLQKDINGWYAKCFDK